MNSDRAASRDVNAPLVNEKHHIVCFFLPLLDYIKNQVNSLIKMYASVSIELEFNPSESELFRDNLESVSELSLMSHSEPIQKNFCISYDEKESKVNSI